MPAGGRRQRWFDRMLQEGIAAPALPFTQCRQAQAEKVDPQAHTAPQPQGLPSVHPSRLQPFDEGIFFDTHPPAFQSRSDDDEES